MNRSVGVCVQLALYHPEHAPLATSRGIHAGRPTLHFGLELTVAGQRSEVWAEACPLPGFGPAADHIDLARAELLALDAGQVSLWLSAPPLAALAACFEATAELASAAARHAVEWAVVEGLARLSCTGPAELLHGWLERTGGPGSWPGPRQVLPTSAVLDLLDPDLTGAALRLAERGILTWKLKCGRHPALEERALEELARLDLPARLRLDPGTCWTPLQGVDFVRGLVALCQRSRLTLEYVEDPTPDPADWVELARLAPLAADEVLEKALSLPPGTSSTRFWVIKPMVHGIGRALELSARGAAAGQHVVISHTFDGPLALRASTELACVVQTHDHAAGLGPHRALEPWSRTDTSRGALLRGERLGPAQLGHDVLLDGGYVARVLSAGRGPADLDRPAKPAGDALSLSRAAALYPRRTFLCLDDRNFTFAELATSLAGAGGAGVTTSGFVPIVAETGPEAIQSLLAALERGVPALLLHPSATDETRARTIEHCQRHAAELAIGDAVIVPTSGSTAAPRLVVHTRASLLSAVSSSAARLGAPTPDTRWLLSLPFAHVGGLSILLRCLAAGACVVSSPLPKTPREVERLLARAHVTHLSIVPTQLGRWLSAADFRFPACVECVLVGGAHAPAGLRQAALDRGAPVLFSYGLTEMGSQVATEAPRVPRDGWQSAVGRPLPGVELTVSADGCLTVGGPMLMRAYLGQPTPGEDGLFRTTDLGRLDADGRLTLLGRTDDMIVSGGENVAPSAVEAALADVTGVLEICVLGRPSSEWGQEVVALIVPHKGLEQAPLEQALRDVARAGLPGFARPKAYRFLDELPRLASGKVDRRLGLELLALSTR